MIKKLFFLISFAGWLQASDLDELAADLAYQSMTLADQERIRVMQAEMTSFTVEQLAAEKKRPIFPADFTRYITLGELLVDHNVEDPVSKAREASRYDFGPTNYAIIKELRDNVNKHLADLKQPKTTYMTTLKRPALPALVPAPSPVAAVASRKRARPVLE